MTIIFATSTFKFESGTAIIAFQLADRLFPAGIINTNVARAASGRQRSIVEPPRWQGHQATLFNTRINRVVSFTAAEQFRNVFSAEAGE